MRLLRLVLMLLLSVALPAHGLVTLAVVAPACPMQHGMQAAAPLAQDTRTRVDAACCNDGDTAGKTGKLCKDGQDCKVGSLGQVPTHAGTVALPLTLETADRGYLARLDASRTRIWRPPSDLHMT